MNQKNNEIKISKQINLEKVGATKQVRSPKNNQGDS